MQASSLCDSLKKWIAGIPPKAEQGNVYQPGQLMPYIEDKHFSRYFGKTYDQLTVADFREASKARSECRKAGVFTPTEQDLVGRIWTQSLQMKLSQELVSARGKREQVGSLSAQLDALGPNLGDFRQIGTIESRGAALSKAISNLDRQAFERKIADTRERIGPPVMKQRVAQEIANARGAGGLTSLGLLLEELASARLGRQHADPLQAQIKARTVELDAQVAAFERTGSPLMSTLSGLPAVEQSKGWLAEYDQRHQRILAVAPSLAKLRQEVLDRRAMQIASAEPALSAEARAASNQQDVSASLSRYLTAQELQTGAGHRIKLAADQRTAALDRVSKNESVFGTLTVQQPQAAAAGQGRDRHPSISQCDLLAADPQDPTRTAAGVTDDDLVAAQALVACKEAVQQQPDASRLKFQLGRALLKAGRLDEAVVAFQEAAKANQPGALAYLATAYEHGAGGVAKDQARSDELFSKAESLGYGSNIAPSTSPSVAQSPSSANSPSGAKLTGTYEAPNLVHAIYNADASLLSEGRMFTPKYLISQAEILMNDCRAFRLSEYRTFQENITRKFIPKTGDEAAAQGLANLMDSMKLLAEFQKNPQSMVEAGRAEQRLEDAPIYAAEDLVEFTKHHGGCGSKPLERYTRNLRAYLERLK